MDQGSRARGTKQPSGAGAQGRRQQRGGGSEASEHSQPAEHSQPVSIRWALSSWALTEDEVEVVSHDHHEGHGAAHIK